MTNIPKPEFPRPEKRRENWFNLNGTWDFKLFPSGSEESEKVFASNREGYDQKIIVPFSWGSPLSGVETNDAGIGWYKKEVEYKKNNRLFICFGAVDYLAEVFLNGNLICKHQGGYNYFEVEVTDLWLEGKNTIEVRAEDYRCQTQLYGKQAYGDIQGIWQTVWLEERSASYIKDYVIQTKLTGEVTIKVSAVAGDGEQVTAYFDNHFWSAEIKDGEATILLEIDSPKLWSPDEPNLYEGYITLAGDQVFTYFGIREISTCNVDGRGYQWILLNNTPIYINGTLDQAFNPNGFFTYPSDEDMYAEVYRLKRLGLNMARIHIKTEEPRKLYWMDKLGMLVMQDIPCFWGEPNEEAKLAYEMVLPDLMARDINHPSIFSWVLFNETWGLLHGTAPNKVYYEDTQEWVRGIYQQAKEIDPTRLIEDNSPCRYDHIETDINTWHFYINTYEAVRDHIREVVDNSYPGSEYNYINGNKQRNAPLMNSECGMIWGVDSTQGDSDIAFQYHYMLNEYRLHEKLCGFVFTQFHDVVNEFTGYYRIDDLDKDFGYQDMCRGMSLRDLHTTDFLATDLPPVVTLKAGEEIAVPMVISSFGNMHHGKQCSLDWELWYDGLEGRVTSSTGTFALPLFSWGTTKLVDLRVTMPEENAVAVLSLYLKDENEEIISRNFTCFDVQATLKKNMTEIPVCEGKVDGFAHYWNALVDDKLSMGGSGKVTYEIELPESGTIINDIIVHFEAGSKRVLKKDYEKMDTLDIEQAFIHDHPIDRGALENSYWMSDETRLPSEIEMLINGESVTKFILENDYADVRGILSWHRQPNPKKLDEAGSFGESKHIAIPSRMLPKIARDKKFSLTFKVLNDDGLALYGRNSGRYAHGLLIETK